jgi:hypothetical protein
MAFAAYFFLEKRSSGSYIVQEKAARGAVNAAEKRPSEPDPDNTGGGMRLQEKDGLGRLLLQGRRLFLSVPRGSHPHLEGGETS